MKTIAAKKETEDQTSASVALALPADGLSSQMAYLTRVLKTPTIGQAWKNSPITPATKTGHTRNTSPRCYNANPPIVNRPAPPCGSAPPTSRQ